MVVGVYFQKLFENVFRFFEPEGVEAGSSFPEQGRVEKILPLKKSDVVSHGRFYDYIHHQQVLFIGAGFKKCIRVSHQHIKVLIKLQQFDVFLMVLKKPNDVVPLPGVYGPKIPVNL